MCLLREGGLLRKLLVGEYEYFALHRGANAGVEGSINGYRFVLCCLVWQILVFGAREDIYLLDDIERERHSLTATEGGGC